MEALFFDLGISAKDLKELLHKHARDSKIGLRLMFISSCPEDWGGSEELWAGAARMLAQSGHRVFVFKTRVNPNHPRIIDLRAAGCTVTDLHHLTALPKTWSDETDWTLQTLDYALKSNKPHLTVIAQGSNFDGGVFADLCRRQNYTYVIIAQKAVDAFYPLDPERLLLQQAYQSAVGSFFVSRHNLKITSLQLALDIPNGKVVWNPVNVPFEQLSTDTFPDMSGPIRLACVARLFILEKGQDLLLEVLSNPRWRSRDVQVTFFGAGMHRVTLEEMVHFLGLEDRVHFAGHVADPAAIWQTHHALVLPSRSEGLPLALVEAMLCGRPAIAANAGGINELLVDNVTGFLAATPSVVDLDEALERAWTRRSDWPTIGKQAAAHALANVPPDAIQKFSTQLLDMAYSILPDSVLKSTMTQPLVSVIIPTYNRAHLIERAIKSVRAQTYTNWQLIIVDDGSTDGTRELLLAIDDIEYYFQEKKGQGAARNIGLQYCRGEYIVSLDSDDEWFPNFLADSVAMLEKHNLDFVFSNHTSSRGDKGQTHFFMQSAQQLRYFTQSDDNWWLLKPDQTRYLMIENCPAISSATVIRKTAMPSAWNETMKIADDWCLILDIVLNRPTRIAFTLTPNWLKHVHDNNIYDNRDHLKVAEELGFHDEKQILNRFHNQLSTSERAIIKARIAMYHYTYAFYKRKHVSSLMNAIEHFGMAFGMAPRLISHTFLKQGQTVLKRRLKR